MNETHYNASSLLDDVEWTDEDRAKACALLREVANFPEWIVDPPEWFIEMYLLDPDMENKFNHIAFQRLRGDGSRYKAILPMMWTHMIIVGHMDDRVGYQDRWCYHDFEAARHWFMLFDPDPNPRVELGNEPGGWHRHPMTGRRREYNADGTYTEIVNP